MKTDNNSKYTLCFNERATYLCINLEELNYLKLDNYILDLAIKNDKYLYIHADCLSLIEDSAKKEGRDFKPTSITVKDLSFLNDTVKFNEHNKSNFSKKM